MARLIKKHPLLSMINGMVIDLPTPANISYLWNYGSLLGVCLVVQILTGIFLAMHYAAHVDLAFSSVEHIMRDVNYGWLLRYLHANGASMFFVMVYIHMARGLYYGSYTKPRVLLWLVGVAIFFLMMGTAFIGYVLPWGQMSFWGATVITNMVSAVPYVGTDLVQWIWGGFAVDNATLNRFFSFHYLLPFILAALVVVHLLALHIDGSNNPLGISSNSDKIAFHPYFTYKDLLGFILFFILFSFFVFFAPNVLGHSDNYCEADPLVTPAHIVPEWYFLAQYAILRGIPNKLLGVIAMGSSIIVLAFLPWLHVSKIRGSAYRPIFKKFYWLFIANFLLLVWLGSQPAEDPYVICAQLASAYYFGYILILTPLIGWLENYLLSFEIPNTNKKFK